MGLCGLWLVVRPSGTMRLVFDARHGKWLLFCTLSNRFIFANATGFREINHESIYFEHPLKSGRDMAFQFQSARKSPLLRDPSTIGCRYRMKESKERFTKNDSFVLIPSFMNESAQTSRSTYCTAHEAVSKMSFALLSRLFVVNVFLLFHGVTAGKNSPLFNRHIN